ncbi:hypothetical protein GCM10011487_10880 [Steroidobacter agaridevorans]|uniref:Uncharacterized protein n=2 Tax=Steroidobacter agaridevorans TaxID=2695856 RepID=A0A829Y889_9GAMM|nr:hypothetical protein GCM10011487_10880 [Steroidobacter agaridevorans]
MKYVLVQMALQSPGRFFDRFGPAGDAQYLPDLWTALGLELEAAERIPNTGAATWYRAPLQTSAEALVLILPDPAGMTEAYFIGVLRSSANACRVFCLERSHSSMSKADTTVLTEFAANGRMNWGPGSLPAVTDFVSLMDRMAADADARPNAFVEMKLA